ncbi:MAG: dual specificity protein phosphatase family protein [Rivularia sp. (in: Bacteria)]|nr:dual specificity protein phosphatase family protein [Rivularia sp. MS3]
MYKFAPASENETIVYGSARPGYNDEKVWQWIEFMQSQGIKRVCCLLAQTQLQKYSNLLELYQQEFGSKKVCWAPIEDFTLIDSQILIQNILPFLAEANRLNEKAVVHCSAGIGRTGQVLAAWLVYKGGFTNQEAISTVMRIKRNPYEFIVTAAMKGENPQKAIEKFNAILDNCRIFGEKDR